MFPALRGPAATVPVSKGGRLSRWASLCQASVLFLITLYRIGLSAKKLGHNNRTIQYTELLSKLTKEMCNTCDTKTLGLWICG